MVVRPTYLEIEAGGEPRAVGRAVGEAARELIAAGLAFYEEFHHEMGPLTFGEAEEAVLAYLPATRRYVPDVLDELEGMAEGAGVPLAKLLVPNLGEELTCNDDPAAETPGVAPLAHGRGRSPGHCTTLAIVAGGRHIVAHNEDWFAGDADKSVVLHITTGDGTRILAVTSAHLLAATGISSHGIASGANTLFSNDTRVGVPNNLLRRWVLGSATLEEARERCLLPARARGSNHLFGDVSGRIVDVETSGTEAGVVEAGDWHVHTNHYLTADMVRFEISSSINTRARLARAREMVAEGLAGGDDPFAIAARVLADHAGEENSICGHPDEADPWGQREMTTASMIWDLDALTADVSFGPPCENERLRFSL